MVGKANHHRIALTHCPANFEFPVLAREELFTIDPGIHAILGET
jgi:hypothetical protein